MPAIGQPLLPRQTASAPDASSSSTPPLPPTVVAHPRVAAGEGVGEWSLRRVTAGDTSAIAELELRLFPDEAWDAAMVLEEIVHPSRRYVAAVDGAHRIVGYAGIMLAGDTADLHTIGGVAEGIGIGRVLLAWCESEAAVHGAERLLLEVRVDNDRARAFYDRAGYEVLGIRRGYYRTPAGAIDAVVMEKELSGT